MKSPVFILDASALLTFLLEENESIERRIQGLLEGSGAGRYRCYASPLLYAEVGNALRFKRAPDAAKAIFTLALQLPLQSQDFTPSILQKALQMSFQCGTTVYDSLYHALALFHQAVLVTADDQYLAAAKPLGSIISVDELPLEL